MIATFAPLGSLNAEVSLNAVAPVDGIAICAPAGITEARAKAKTRRFIVQPILAASSSPSKDSSEIHLRSPYLQARENLFLPPGTPRLQPWVSHSKVDGFSPWGMLSYSRRPSLIEQPQSYRGGNENARHLPIHSQPLDTDDKIEPDTNSPARAGPYHLTQHFNHSKSKPKVSPSKTLRKKPREGGGTMTATRIRTPKLALTLLLTLIPAF